MKIVYLTVLCFISFLSHVRSQQKPHYTQYLLNQYILNPALTGIENYTDIKMSHRVQWDGFKGAPVTSYFTVNTPLGKKTISNDRIYNYKNESIQSVPTWDEGEPMNPYHGIGLQLVNDVIGPFNTLTGFLTYAYHMSLNRDTRLSAGLGAGLNSQRLNVDDLYFGNTANFDPAAVQQTLSNERSKLDLNFGLWLYKKNLFAGFSVQQLIPQFIGKPDVNSPILNGSNVPHYFFTAGYSMNHQSGISFITSVMIKYISSAPIQADINVKGQIGDLFFVGASYRTGYGFAGLTGLTFNNKWMLTYSYDYTTTILNQVSRGSHEIILGYRLRGDKILPCPVGVW